MTLYALRPDPVTGSVDEDSEVVFQSRYGWQFLEEAVTLWRLVGSSRAEQIEAVMERASRAAGEGELRFYAPDLDELVRLLEGVAEAVIGAGIVDQQWRVPANRLEELANRVPGMDLKTERSLESKTHALGEVMSRAESARMFLSNARDAGCVVAVG